MFESIVGQEQVKRFFTAALEADDLGHAYLFTGPEGLAKTAFARELAAAMVASCGGCGGCAECDRARRGIHPDLHVLEREGDLIRVDQVEPLIADLSLKPFAAGGRRVWMIPEVERLHPAAANKLLKSIEEPPRYVHFLLVTDHVEQVLPTILSRCQQVEFRPVSAADVRRHLQRDYALEGAEAEALARLSAGSVERADRFAFDARGHDRRREYLTQAAAICTPGSGEDVHVAQDAFLAILEGQHAEIKVSVQEAMATRLAALAEQFQDARERKWRQDRATTRADREVTRLRRLASFDALDVLVSWVRDLWVVACGVSEVLCNCDREAELRAAAVATPEHYARLLSATAQTRKDLHLNIDQKLALQALFARFEEVAESA